MKVTDEMIEVALTAYWKNPGHSKRMQTALEAVFDHIADKGKMVDECVCEKPFIRNCVNCIRCGNKLPDHIEDKLEKVERNKDNISNSTPLEQSNDGWIEHDGSTQCPINTNTKAELKYLNGETKIVDDGLKGKCWKHDKDYPYDVVAYRIIEEPKDDGYEDNPFPDAKIGKRVEDFLPPPEELFAKQTFEQWAIRQTPQGNLDLLTPSDIICLVSEWEQNK